MNMSTMPTQHMHVVAAWASTQCVDRLDKYWTRGKVGMLTLSGMCMLQSIVTPALCIPNSSLSRGADQ